MLRVIGYYALFVVKLQTVWSKLTLKIRSNDAIIIRRSFSLGRLDNAELDMKFV